MAYRRTSRGVGAVQFTDFPKDFMGYPIPCDVWFNWIGSPACWKNSLSDWQAMANAARSGSGVPFTPADIQAPAAVPLATSGEADYAGTEAEKLAQFEKETSGVLNDAMRATQRNLLQSARTATGYPDPEDPDRTNWLLWGGLAALGVVAMVAFGGGSPRRYGR